MNKQLSFTQALRENGFTQSNENIQKNNNEDTIEQTEKIEETETSEKTQEVTEEVSEDNIVNNNNINEKDKDEEQVMYIGNKSVMNYVYSLIKILNEGTDVINIKARGRAINRAVDVVEVLRHRFITDLTIEDISISTQQIIRDNEKESNVSAINIKIKN